MNIIESVSGGLTVYKSLFYTGASFILNVLELSYRDERGRGDNRETASLLV